MIGCIGYRNYGYFLQFSFYGALWTSSLVLFAYFHFDNIVFSYFDFIFFVMMSILALFAWAIFFGYGTMALKGFTIIEASDRFAHRHTNAVLIAESRFPRRLLMGSS